MDFFPDFDEFGLAGILIPSVVFLGVFLPVYRKLTSDEGGFDPIMLIVAMVITCAVMIFIVIGLLVAGCVVFKLDNP